MSCEGSELTLRKQTRMLEYVKQNNLSRYVFKLFHRDVDVDTFVPQIGLTLGQFHAYYRLLA